MSLSIKNLSFSYKNQCIFNKSSFEAPLGKVSVLLGASGIGKTTLFKLISGLLPLDEGEMILKNREGLSLAVRDHFTYMQQNDLLLPWRTVIQNLLLNCELNKTSLDKKSYLSKMEDLLKKMGVYAYKDAFPHELSGGMRQRVSLTRAILQDKLVLLLDEPFSSSDIIIKENLYSEIKMFIAEHNRILLLITHDFRDALALADYIFVIVNHTVRPIPLKQSIASMSREQKAALEEQIKSYLTHEIK